MKRIAYAMCTENCNLYNEAELRWPKQTLNALMMACTKYCRPNNLKKYELVKLKELPFSLFQSIAISRKPIALLCSNECSRSEQKVDALVSLTSIESRLKILHLTIRSLLLQSVRPKKIILWLHKDLKKTLPAKLKELQSERFEICYSEEKSAHRKLVESLRRFPHDTIITCDDDVMYETDWLLRLWNHHLKYPKDIVAHECRVISYTGETIEPYEMWQSEAPGASHPETLAIGYAGVLYPKDSLHKDVTNQDLYMTLAPRADDLWFKAMSYLSNTLTRRTSEPMPKPTPIAFSQRMSLKHFNVKQDGNRLQWKKISAHYGIKFD